MYTFSEDCYYPIRLLVSDLGSYWGCPQCMWSGEVFDITQRADLAAPTEVIPFTAEKLADAHTAAAAFPIPDWDLQRDLLD